MRGYRRTPRHYDGVTPTGHPLRGLLAQYLRKVNAHQEECPSQILAYWPHLVGPALAEMSEAIAFKEGILTVKVGNSTLYSLLANYEKQKLLKKLRKQFPQTVLKTIVFRMR